MPRFSIRQCPRCHVHREMWNTSQVCAGCRIREERAIASLPKGKAWIAVAKALRAGKLVRLPCEVCGTKRTDAHHDDYAAPLDVRWLCRSHHRSHHHQFGPGKNAFIEGETA